MLSFIICGFGLMLSFVFFNPWGFVIDDLGLMLFFYGLKADDNKATKLTDCDYSNYINKREN